jgi:uncharacterized protein (UPF0335 family)
MGAIGKNTVSGKLLLEFVERVEVIRKQKKDLSNDEAAVMADAKAAGFNKKGIRFVVKAREMKPSDLQDWQALTDMYMHAIGMGVEPPLFRAAGLAAIDINVREQVLAAMHAFVPPHGKGSITVDFDGRKIQLTRGKEGEIEMQDVVDDDDSQPSSLTRGGRAAGEAPARQGIAAGDRGARRERRGGSRPAMGQGRPAGHRQPLSLRRSAPRAFRQGLALADRQRRHGAG